MSPLEIRILLHYHYSPEDFYDLHNKTRRSEAAQDFIEAFVKNGCLVPGPGGDSQFYKLGERGQAFVDHIRALPLPRAEWVMDPVTGSGPPIIGFELSDNWKSMSVADRAKVLREHYHIRPGRGPQGA